jgi:tRNA pseudouridine55 synthase
LSVHGVLVVDKPQGPTSHDVVAVARRCTGESHIGHTGTLDPLATGVLPLACGHATRLMRFLSASDKDYVAGIRFGFTTDSYDTAGTETSRTDAVPGRDAIDRALVSLRGEYLQMPPPFSAKKIDGERAYVRARRRETVTLTPVQVRVPRVELLAFEGATARIGLTCSAGFYVRAFAQALGEMVGTGACLESLRRTRSGEFALADAMTMDRLQSADREWTAHVMPLERLLPGLPATTVTDEGRRRVSHGQDLLDAHVVKNTPPGADMRGQEWVRLLDSEGRLLGLGTSGASAGSLHPAVVLI